MLLMFASGRRFTGHENNSSSKHEAGILPTRMRPSKLFYNEVPSEMLTKLLAIIHSQNEQLRYMFLYASKNLNLGDFSWIHVHQAIGLLQIMQLSIHSPLVWFTVYNLKTSYPTIFNITVDNTKEIL